MQRVTLAGTGIETSRLGFGCVGLTSLNDRRKALRLLETAFESGVTHFDVARLYGSGQAEGILGEFLRGKRDRVTVMTKFGKEPPKMAGGGGGGGLKKVVKWGMQRSGFLKKLVAGAANKATVRGMFDPASAEASLTTSLRELGTEYVDFLMLHDCTMDDARRDDTLGFLRQQVEKGRVRAFGVTMGVNAVAGQDVASLAGGQTCVMFPSNAVEPTIDGVKGLAGRGVFTCRPVKFAGAMAAAARKESGAVKPLVARLGVDPLDADALAGVLLRDAMRRNGAGVVVFSTTKAERIGANVRAAFAGGAADERTALAELVRAVGARLGK